MIRDQRATSDFTNESKASGEALVATGTATFA
jgi:hypothetical protein